jgi:hypothetical protein
MLLGLGLLGVGAPVATIVWQTVRDDVPRKPLWTNPIFDGSVLMAVAGALILLSLLPWSDWFAHRPRKRVRFQTAHEAPRLTGDEAKELVLRNYWGEKAYKASSAWNGDEQRAYLHLECRDVGLIHVRISVVDPTQGPAMTYEFGTEARADARVVTAWFPDAFRSAPPSLVRGDYLVKWEVLIAGGEWAEADASDFRIPHGGPDRVTRREILYDESGREAGEEIVHESGRRDAMAKPETVAAVGKTPPTSGADRIVEKPGTGTPWIVSPIPPVTEARALSRQVGETVQVVLRNLNRVPQTYHFNWVVCEVTHANGVPSERSKSLALGASLLGLVPHDIVFDYPFSELDRPLVDGMYPVLWLARPFASSAQGQLILARDQFTLEDGTLVVRA